MGHYRSLNAIIRVLKKTTKQLLIAKQLVYLKSTVVINMLPLA